MRHPTPLHTSRSAAHHTSSSAALAMSNNAPHLMKNNAPPLWRHPMNRSAPPPTNNSAPQHMRPPMRRSAPPPTSKCAPALAMAVTEREVLDMDKNNPAPRFLRKVAQVSQSRNQSRNAPLCPRRAAAVFLYKLPPRLPRRSAVVVVVVVALVVTMDRGMVKVNRMDLQK